MSKTYAITKEQIKQAIKALDTQMDGGEATDMLESLHAQPAGGPPQNKEKLDDLLGQYWDIAYSEGSTGVSRGDEAGAVLSAIQTILCQPKRETVACTPLRIKAIELYKPPFKYEHGYIYDAEHHMVADDDDVESHVAARVRGWGRIGYMPDAEALQDEVGKHIAELLTKHWATATHPPAHLKMPTEQELSQCPLMMTLYGCQSEAIKLFCAKNGLTLEKL